MLWVEKDASGKPQFALNHAYPIDNDSGAAMWALFDAPSAYQAQGFVDYTRMVTSGEVLSKNRDGSQALSGGEVAVTADHRHWPGGSQREISSCFAKTIIGNSWAKGR